MTAGRIATLHDGEHDDHIKHPHYGDRGLPTRGGGTGEGVKPFGGVADQCGTCHQVMWECPWQVRAHEIRDLPQAEQKAAWDALGLHPR